MNRCKQILKFGDSRPWAIAAAVGLAIMGLAGGALAQSSDPLLNTLIKKGILTEDEARNIKAEADANQSNNLTPPPSKWKIGAGIKNIELFGDIRTRFEDRGAHDPFGGSIDLERFRYALRIGLRGEAFDGFYYGVRLDTASNPRSPWVTFGTAASGNPYQGPFGKSQAGLDVGQIYLGWRALGWLDVSIGKTPNPIYTTPMIWDTDFNPEGITERFKYTVGEADLFATFGQYLYQDVNPVNASPGYFNLGYNTANPAFLMAWQAGFNYHITRQLTLKAAPVLYTYSAHGQNTVAGGFTPDFSGTFVGQGASNGVAGTPAASSGFPGGMFDGFAANQTGINDLMILDFPWEFNYDLNGTMNLRLFGDFAENLNGNARAQAAYTQSQQNQLLINAGVVPIPSPQTHDNKAYQVGVAIGSEGGLGLVYGSTSRKNAWEFRTYWQHVEQYALDPNLLDSDFFEGRGNLEGIYAAFAYGFTDGIIGTIRYGNARRINNNLGTGGSNQDIPQMNPIERYDLLQLDLALRF